MPSRSRLIFVLYIDKSDFVSWLWVYKLLVCCWYVSVKIATSCDYVHEYGIKSLSILSEQLSPLLRMTVPIDCRLDSRHSWELKIVGFFSYKPGLTFRNCWQGGWACPLTLPTKLCSVVNMIHKGVFQTWIFYRVVQRIILYVNT
jgi:hypothetical protein